MKLTQQSREERAEALRQVGVHVDRLDNEGSRIIIRLPGYLGVPIAVSDRGMVGRMYLDEWDQEAEFSLRRLCTAHDAAQRLVSDLFGEPTGWELERALQKLGWQTLQPTERFSGIRVTLLEGPPRVGARVVDRAVSIEETAKGPPHSELTVARAQPRLKELRETVEMLYRARRKAGVRTVEDYLPPVPEILVRLARPDAAVTESRPWSDLFRRLPNHRSGLPQFFLRYSHYGLCEKYEYEGGDEQLDGLLALFGIFGLDAERWGASSPMNATDRNLAVRFLDGGLKILSGNYFCGPHGVYVVGFLAMRFLVWHLGYRQPRRLKGEDRAPTPDELEHICRHPQLFRAQAPAIDWRAVGWR